MTATFDLSETGVVTHAQNNLENFLLYKKKQV